MFLSYYLKLAVLPEMRKIYHVYRLALYIEMKIGSHGLSVQELRSSHAR